MNSVEVAKIHNELFQFLLNYQKNHEDFYFMPRQTNRYGRLDHGYWFRGNDDLYLSIGFYSGEDGSNKTSNISFQMYLKEVNGKPEKTSFIQLSNTPDSNAFDSKMPVLSNIMQELGGFEVNCSDKNGVERRWNRYYSSTNYLKCIEEFLVKDKPIIDYVIKEANNPDIGLLNKEISKQKISNIIDRLVNQR
jgi:hypothetical protein